MPKTPIHTTGLGHSLSAVSSDRLGTFTASEKLRVSEHSSEGGSVSPIRPTRTRSLLVLSNSSPRQHPKHDNGVGFQSESTITNNTPPNRRRSSDDLYIHATRLLAVEVAATTATTTIASTTEDQTHISSVLPVTPPLSPAID